jgi:hypothetical protein
MCDYESVKAGNHCVASSKTTHPSAIWTSRVRARRQRAHRKGGMVKQVLSLSKSKMVDDDIEDFWPQRRC